MLLKNILLLFLSLLFLTTSSSGNSNILINGTSIYLTTGDSYGLYQGYIINLKSVSGDGSIWLQLTEKDVIVKSDIVAVNEYFMYNKTNRTILSIRVQNVYSGSSEQNLVALSPVYQFLDPGFPAPAQTGIIPENNEREDNNISSPKMDTQLENLIWILGIFLTLTLFYILRKLW